MSFGQVMMHSGGIEAGARWRVSCKLSLLLVPVLGFAFRYCILLRLDVLGYACVLIIGFNWQRQSRKVRNGDSSSFVP